MSDLTCDLSGLTAKNLLKLSSLCDENGNAYLKTDYSAEIPPTPLNIVTSCPCEFWFDGQDAATFALNGNRVIQWDDKSGNTRHVSNAVDAQRPTYSAVTGRLTFNNVASTYLQSATFGPLAQPNTIFVLYKITGVLGDTEVILENEAGAQNVFYYTAGNFSLYNTAIALPNGATNANDNIHCGEFNGVASNYWINGVNVAAGAVGVNPVTGITIGANIGLVQNADAEIMEVFGYNCLLTNQEHSDCFDYINNKWSLGYVNPW